MRRSTTLAKVFVLFLAFAMLFTATPMTASAQSIGISVSFGPPPIPYYIQPQDPQPNDIWSPGYWGYDPNAGYYWVPGTWVPAPQYGYLWTPGYWAWNGMAFVWSSGYWAPQVGWYGGVNYGYGYYGRGYAGGRWHGHQFQYNTAVSNVNRNYVRDVYSNAAVANHTWNRTSYNGGRGGVSARPTESQLAVARGPHAAPTNVQMQHARIASTNRANFSTVSHGRPATAAIARPYTAANRPAARSAMATHAAPQRMAAPQRAAAMPEAHRAAPVQHAYAAPQRTAPVQHAYAAPQRAAPVQRAYAAPQHMAAPQRMAAPAQHAAAPRPAAPAGDKRHDDAH